MPNEYASVVSLVSAINVFEGTINPPNAFSMPRANIVPQPVYEPLQRPSKDTNIFVRRMGIFSNFADGLVFGKNASRIGARLLATTFQKDETVSGTITFTRDSKAITSGDIDLTTIEYMREINASNPSQWFYIDAATAAAGAANLFNYSRLDGAKAVPGAVEVLSGSFSNGVAISVYDIPALNTMVDVNYLLTPSEVSTAAGMSSWDYIGLFGSIDLDGTDMSFLTKSISTAFASDDITFDLVAEIEYTPAS